MRTTSLVPCLLLSLFSYGQADKRADSSSLPPAPPAADKEALKFNLNADGSHYFQFTVMNQTWVRFNENNPGTLVENKPKDNSFDIGLRRTRIQAFGQLTDKVFIYFQFGMNNFNSQYNTGSNRKLHAFFHDALCEYKVSTGNQLKVGGGLTIANGLSRFSQPGVSSIMTMDVPVFAQSTVDQTDEFSRKLSIYARGQVGKFDYRFILSDPFPISSSGTDQRGNPNSFYSTFAGVGHQLQPQAYLMYQFFDHENHTTPYMTGTYLGKKKIFNIAAGGIFQKDAMWKQSANSGSDTIYQDMKLFAVESFLDMPLSSKQDAISAYAGFFNTDYGTNYLRYNGSMNPANGRAALPATFTGQGPTHGNAYPMFGTGQVVYSQVGYLLPENFLKSKSRFMPYVTFTTARFDQLQDKQMNVYNAGINCLVNGHRSKFTLDWQNRPTYEFAASGLKEGPRKNSVVLQYQIFF